ncbi:SpoIIE family protein phosphatase [Leptospira sp. 201903070]|uniref:SpoIIE family protein phosphatase n=1 Tax=Leptospira ainlahdjerensis TaxID=2810033 RepID=A0ABS2U6X7_9LEPT|nr:SpoIIE family protein phosphatase [Leptospira ainlahdjerensis]MBM9575554.1 SpoIIE family protein phosphatase [Leptospira ainlahdjerensis]
MISSKKQDSLLRQTSDGKLYLEDNPGLTIVFESLLTEIIQLTSAKFGIFNFRLEDGSPRSILGNPPPNAIEEAGLISDFCFKTGQDVNVKKGKSPSRLIPPLKYNAVCCVLHVGELGVSSSENQKKIFGTIFLGRPDGEGGEFRESDFDHLRATTRIISDLLEESFVSGESSLVVLSLMTTSRVALESVQIRKQTDRFDFLLTEIIRVSGLINKSLDLSQLLEAIMLSSKSVFRTEACSVLLLDDSREYLYFHTVLGEKKDEVTKVRVPVGKGVAGMVVQDKEPMIINDAMNDPRVYREVDKVSHFVTRNIMAAPLLVEGQVIGVIEAINTIDRSFFTEEDLELFLSFSGTSALAIQKTGLLQNLEAANKDLRKKVSELESLFELSQVVSSAKNQADLMKQSIPVIHGEMDAGKTGIFLINRKLGILTSISFTSEKTVEIFRTTSYQGSFIHRSIEEEKTTVKEDIQNFAFDHELDLEYLKGSYIVLPLTHQGRSAFGAITVSDRVDKLSYNHSHLRLLQTFASLIARGHETLKLQNEMISRKALQRSLEREIEITREIQKNILPEPKSFNSNFDLGVKSVPAKEVSGDFYDYYQYQDGQYSFLVSDVSGKSLPAAIFMAMSSSIIRTLARNHDLNPEEILKQGNALIYEDSHNGMFVTTFFIHYNPAIFTLDYASAGHNDQILIRKNGTWELIKGSGPPLGVVTSASYKGGSLIVEPGDMVILYTDGAIEEKNSKDEEFGLERMIQEIIARRDLPSTQIIDELFGLVREFSGTPELYDDFTVMILKFNDDYQFSREFEASTSAIPLFREFVYETIKVRDLDEALRDDILLACDEAGTNIVMHGYENTSLKNPKFECKIRFTGDWITIVLIDSGKVFQRKKVQEPSIEDNLSGKRKGGFGVYLIEKLMDSVEYSSEGGRNVLVLKKNFQHKVSNGNHI